MVSQNARRSTPHLTMASWVAVGAIALLLGPVQPAQSQRPTCSRPDTPENMAFCVNEAFTAADAELNWMYNEVISNLSEPRRELLIDAQLDWINYRDAACEFEVSGRLGSIVPLLEITCQTRLTNVRTEELTAYQYNYYPNHRQDLASLERQHRSIVNNFRAYRSTALLDASERTWQQYRDTVCRFERTGGGNAAWENCRIRLTQQRISDLNLSAR
ncbi:MAG: DUF1311 domain-containing protein [Phormidium sp. SL48-SHIP]|nr:MAG: DUF1311 domain-containing protein [Phormidium sp. SL48-SHIP]